MEIKKLPKSQIEIHMVISAAELDKFLEAAMEDLGKDLKIDGFRPGKAPHNIVEQKIGAEKILAHGAEKAVKKTYVDAIKKNEIDAIGEPKITITKIAKGNDLEYKAVVSVMPKVTLGNYRKEVLKVKKDEKSKVSPEKIEEELKTLAKSRAKLITVAKPAKKGDRLEIDFEVSMDKKAIEGGVSKNHPLTIGESYFIPGFEENLIGLKENETKEFELKFPDDYHKKDLAGKPAKFRVKINLVQEKQIPEINDEFAKSLGNFSDLHKLRENFKEGMEKELEQKNHDQWRTDAIEKIVSISEMEVPDLLLEGELDKMMAEFEQNIAQMGMDMQTYLENIKKSKEDLRKSWNETGEKRVKAAMVLREIANAEEIKVEAQEIEEEMNKVLAHYKSVPDMEKNVDMERLHNYVQGVLTNEKVFKFLESLK